MQGILFYVNLNIVLLCDVFYKIILSSIVTAINYDSLNLTTIMICCSKSPPAAPERLECMYGICGLQNPRVSSCRTKDAKNGNVGPKLH